MLKYIEEPANEESRDQTLKVILKNQHPEISDADIMSKIQDMNEVIEDARDEACDEHGTVDSAVCLFTIENDRLVVRNSVHQAEGDKKWDTVMTEAVKRADDLLVIVMYSLYEVGPSFAVFYGRPGEFMMLGNHFPCASIVRNAITYAYKELHLFEEG